MISSRFIIRQRVSALLLLTLLVGISGFKVFHTHDVNFVHLCSQQDHEIVSNNNGEKSLHCSICDYQLTGIVNLDFKCLCNNQTDYSILFIEYSEPVFSSFFLSFSDRGPPSVMV